MAGVKIEGLQKQYIIGSQIIYALKNISLHIPEGSFTVVVGKSGCGKTTLLRMLCGLEIQTAGKIEFTTSKNYEVKKEKNVGIVFQEPRLMPWLTVKQNMAFPLLNKLHKKQIDSIVEKHINIMGLEKFKDAYPSQISGGMAQRTALGRTLCYDPDIILMDEPFAALDYFTRTNLQDEMVGLFLSQQKTIVFVTHNVEEAVYLGEKIVVLDQGEVILDYPVELPYPRQSTSLEFVKIKEEILNAITNDNQSRKKNVK